MKIFISHSSKNSIYGQAIVDLLINVGINSEQIIFTSNDAFGIPNGQNIFSWLKARIAEKPHVIYLLSPDYYSSIACLNEMGAAWIVENEHTIIFTPEFKSSSYEFQNGALDPREMGFKINNHDRVILFIETLRKDFPISTNPVLVGQKIREFINKVNSIDVIIKDVSIKSTSLTKNQDIIDQKTNKNLQYLDNGNKLIEKVIDDNSANDNRRNIPETVSILSHTDKFINDFKKDKLKDEEVLLIYYAIDTARFKLGTGWKSDYEIENIKTWQDVHSLNSKLSNGYDETIRRFGVKKIIEVTEVTGSGNPREVMLISDLQDILLVNDEQIDLKIKEVSARNEKSIPSEYW